MIRRALPPRPANRELRQAYRRWRLKRLEEEEYREIADLQRRVIERLDYYHEIPLIDDLRATWNGTLWVLRTPEDGFPWEMDDTDSLLPVGKNTLRLNRDPSPIDIVTPNGLYVGTLPADKAIMPVAFGPDGLAAYIEIDDMDVQTVVVRRLPKEIR